MPQGIAHGDEIEGFIGEGKGFAKTLDERDRLARAILLQHSLARIEADDVFGRESELERGPGDQTGAGGHVEHLHARPEAGASQRHSAIGFAGPKRKRGGQAVVMLRRMVKNLLDEIRTLARRGDKFRQVAHRAHRRSALNIVHTPPCSPTFIWLSRRNRRRFHVQKWFRLGKRALLAYAAAKFVRVLIVPDKFKGTLTAAEVAEAIARGWRRVRPDDVFDLLPMSDGGDGFGEVISSVVGAKPAVFETIDAAHGDCAATWWHESAGATAIIESARVVGLAQLPPGKYHPFDLDTEGLGRLLTHVSSRKIRRLIVGVGGSATNDGGFGMARALGWSFLDAEGNALERWKDLRELHALRAPTTTRVADDVTVAVDVQNPLLGPEGCSRVYGPQKGLRPQDFALAEDCLEKLASVVKHERGTDFSKMPGAGAAGGLGFGLCAFVGANVAPGFQLFAEGAGLAERLDRCDLVLTAEGGIDRQTLMGKGVGRIALLCRERGLPCIALAGVVQEPAQARELFRDVLALTDITSSSEAMKHAALWLERRTAQGAEQFDLQRLK
jgi:glycerate 2-kinase